MHFTPKSQTRSVSSDTRLATGHKRGPQYGTRDDLFGMQKASERGVETALVKVDGVGILL